MTLGADKVTARIHFGSGTSIDTILDETDAKWTDTDVEDYIEEAIKGEEGTAQYGKPRWTWIGDVYLYTQTVEGVEVL